MKTDVPAIFDGFYSTYFDTLHLSNKIIQISRVDQAICDEAEAGRAHGDCIIDNGCLMLSGGQTRIRLGQGFKLGFDQQNWSSPLDFFSGGQPLIETAGLTGPMPSNGCGLWQTQFPYLRGSVFPRISGNYFDSFGISEAEYQQAAALGGKWELSGNWGDPNRLGGEGNWHYDDSLLTTGGDSSGYFHLVCGANGQPQYVMGRYVTPLGNILFLPIRYLKRPGFWGARRVFFPPENDIAIWYNQPFMWFLKNIILTADPNVLLRGCNASDTIIGCLPGGASSVDKTDISTLRNRKCWIPIGNENSQSDVEFAVTLTARLQREYQTAHIILLAEEGGVTRPVEIGLSGLCRLARRHKLFVPEELQGKYLGDLTDAIAEYVPAPIINEMLNAGEVVRIIEHDIPSLLLPAHFTKQLQHGDSIWNGLWGVPKPQDVAIIVDRGSYRAAARYRIAGKIADCRFIDAASENQQRAFRALIGSAKVVILAASELIEEHPDICLETLRTCLAHRIAVILFSNAALSPKLNRMVCQAFTASCIGGKGGITITFANDEGGVEAVFDGSGTLCEAKPLSNGKRDLVGPAKSIPSPPPDSRVFMELAGLPPEQKLLVLNQK